MLRTRAAPLGYALLERLACTEHSDIGIARRQSLLLCECLDGVPATSIASRALGVFRPASQPLSWTAEFSAPSGEIPQGASSRSNSPDENPRISRDRSLLVLAQLLPSPVASTHVFRAAVVSIVLTLAVGQNAALLCSVWCHPPEAASGACEPQHQATSPSLTGNDSCTQVAAGATAFVREDVRRGAAPDAQHSVVVAWFQFAPPQAHSTSGRQPRQQSPLGASPLILALRI